MLGTIIGLIFALIVLGVIAWAVTRLLALVPMAEPFRTIVNVLVILLGVLIVLWVIATLLGMAGLPVRWPRF